MSYFSVEQLLEIDAKLGTIGATADRLMLGYVAFPFTSNKAREYAREGFARRVQTLRRCLEATFDAVPPDTVTVPEKSRRHIAETNVQTFIANVYGSVDNLAWVWVHERGLAPDMDNRQVGLRKNHTQVRHTLSAEFRSYLERLDGGWFAYITEYRDALAHRIPVYIPPGGVRPRDLEAYNDLTQHMNEALGDRDSPKYEKLSAEQDMLLTFQPLMTHSTSETKAHFAFHAGVDRRHGRGRRFAATWPLQLTGLPAPRCAWFVRGQTGQSAARTGDHQARTPDGLETGTAAVSPDSAAVSFRLGARAVRAQAALAASHYFTSA
jgi:hypothetical protein